MADINDTLFGTDLLGESAAPAATGAIQGRFVVPPFTVFDAKQGYWMDRKRAWMALGIESELGRDVQTYRIGVKYTYKSNFKTDTSVFDPVLCEVLYRWFCPEGGQVIDPFAGGSVRGIVAHVTGRRYWGVDLSAKQIEANLEQARRIAPDALDTGALQWVVGDAMEHVPQAPLADFALACPPYGDLERYSDDPRDLSTMEYHTFVAAYRRIILRVAHRLRDNTFAAFVVADIRDKKGLYRGFVCDTIRAFEQVGMPLYNEAVLLTPLGTLGLRITKQFQAGRKLGKAHQNVLVFVKGDPKRAAAACAKVEE